MSISVSIHHYIHYIRISILYRILHGFNQSAQPADVNLEAKTGRKAAITTLVFNLGVPVSGQNH